MSKATRKLTILTSGCRLNQYESEKIAAQLRPFGFERADTNEIADLYVINTCTITHRADSSSRALIRKASRENPSAPIVVVGCYVESDPEKISGMEGVDVIVNNTEKEQIAKILPSKLPDLFSPKPDNDSSTQIGDFHGHNRAWIGISDGCHQRCSFCILPSIRGDQVRHRSPEDILSEVNALSTKGFREICLTGLNIGYYQWHDNDTSLANLPDLCRYLFNQSSIDRLRLSSIEPQTVDQNVIDLIRELSPKICRHLHISMQSGSSRILRLMRRPYDRDEYIRRVTAAKEAIPNLIVGADIIVGFPGETDRDFNQSKSLAESGLLDYLHVFSYSDRHGTPAAALPNKINPGIIKERNAILKQVSNKMKLAAHQRQVDQTLEVISEFSAAKDRIHYGVADNYIRVRLPKGINSGKEIVRVRITAASDDCVTGELIS